MTAWMEVEPQKVFPKRHSKHPRSPYRENKQAAHKTRGGKGIVARIPRRQRTP